jgi:tetratricopeptide (TPR) repeat protein
MILSAVLILFVNSLSVGCSSCSDKGNCNSPNNPDSKPNANIKELAPIEQAQNSMEKGDYSSAIKSAKKAFDLAFEKNPKSPETWAIYLKMCEAQAQFQSPQATLCYDRFFRETKGLKMDERTMATALRWRIVISLQQERSVDALKYWNKLEPIEQRLITQGMLKRQEQAYSSFLHGGVYLLQNEPEKAEFEFARAIALYYESGEKNPAPLMSYLDKHAEVLRKLGRSAKAMTDLNELEKLTIAQSGQISPEVAIVRLKKINILLDMGDEQQARSMWDYVQNIIGRYKKTELPPEIDTLYVETMIRLDVSGTLR